jgi:hypothetical protein
MDAEMEETDSHEATADEEEEEEAAEEMETER